MEQGRFNLLKNFSLGSLIAILIAAILLGWMYRIVAINELKHSGNRNNIVLAQAMSNAIWAEVEAVMGLVPNDRDFNQDEKNHSILMLDRAVKDLVQKFHMRVEMRQIGVRHEAKMVGGLGSCGRQLCCTSFLNNFDPVSIKMAKAQNLSLNPSKISGMCGRLMCCLNYEHAYYENAKKKRAE